MATKTGLFLGSVGRIRNLSTRRNFTVGKIIFNKPKSTPKGVCAVVDVPGLTSAVLKVPSEPVGPGASKETDYKNPEYFCYDKNSFFEAEIEMQRFRCPQPSNKIKFVQQS